MKILRIWNQLKECDLYTGTNHKRAGSFCRGQSLRCGVTKKIYTKIKDLSSEPLIGVKEPLKDMLAACGVIIVYLPIIDNITSTCITYSKGNSIVLGIPTEDSDAFWTLLEEALQNLVERDFPHSNRKYRNNDPVTVVNY